MSWHHWNIIDSTLQHKVNNFSSYHRRFAGSSLNFVYTSVGRRADRRHLHTISVMCQQNSILIYFKPLFLIGCLISLAPNAHLNNDWHWLFKWIVSIHGQSYYKIYIVSQPITSENSLITQPITDADKFPLGFSFVYVLTEYVILLKALSFFSFICFQPSKSTKEIRKY